MAVLLIVDVQAGFINDWTRHIPEAVESLQGRFAGVFASRFENAPDSPFRKWKGLMRFAPGTPETALAFAPRKDACLFAKHGYSAASDAVVAAAKTGDSPVYLCGIATDNCVLATAIDLFEMGIRPVVIADVCASHGGPDCHKAGLLLLGRLLGEAQIVSSARLAANA